MRNNEDQRKDMKDMNDDVPSGNEDRNKMKNAVDSEDNSCEKATEAGKDAEGAEKAPVEDGAKENADGSRQENRDEKDLKIAELNKKLEDAIRQKDEYLDLLRRITAEFDNYKKRTQKEKEMYYYEVAKDIIAQMLPVLDNLERAVQAANASETKSDEGSLKEGVNMILRQFYDQLKKLGVEEIKALGETFNPELHNAVAHVESDEAGESEIVEVLQKGYVIKDKVIRHSMVKVAN